MFLGKQHFPFLSSTAAFFWQDTNISYLSPTFVIKIGWIAVTLLCRVRSFWSKDVLGFVMKIFFRQCVSCFLQVLQIFTNFDVWFVLPSCCRYDPWKMRKNVWRCMLRQKPCFTKMRKCKIWTLRFSSKMWGKNQNLKNRDCGIGL